MFQLEEDYLSIHSDNQVQFLDLKVSVETEYFTARRLDQQEEEGDGQERRGNEEQQSPSGLERRLPSSHGMASGEKPVQQVKFEFYSKNMASQRVISEAYMQYHCRRRKHS